MIKFLSKSIEFILELLSTIFFFKKNIKKVENVFFISHYGTGGAEKVHLEIVKSLNTYKSIVLFVSTSKDDTFYLGFKNHAFINEIPQGIYKYNFAKKILISIIFFLKKGNIKNIFGCNNYLFYEIVSKLSTPKFRVIDLIHAFSYPDLGIENFTIKFVDKIDIRLVINQKTKNDYIKQYIDNKIPLNYIERIKIIQNGVSIPEYLKKSKNDKLNILYAGRTTIEKRTHLYTNIAKEQKDKYNFYMAGELENNIDISNITYLGNLKENELQKRYQIMDILILTSYREGFPMVIMEAMANGVVCIATDVGSISEHLKDNFNGFLIVEKDEAEIINKIIERLNYLNENRIILNNISKNSYSYAKENFNLNTFHEKYRKLFS